MIVIGIDPGKSGGIAIHEHSITKAIKCPKTVIEMSSVINSCTTSGWVDNHKVVAYIENVWAFPTDARSAAFKFGVNYGLWHGLLASHKIETHTVVPRVWMKHWEEQLGIEFPKDKQERKRNLKGIAQQQTDKKVTLYNADAILIALYGLSKETEVNEDDRKENTKKG